MKGYSDIELYLLKCASLKLAIDQARSSVAIEVERPIEKDDSLRGLLSQFPMKVRQNAVMMAEYYKLFFMLENEIRRLIDETLSGEYGDDWWKGHVPPEVDREYQYNFNREKEAGVTSRSDSELDYISFGQLGEIIRHNWGLFGGILRDSKALGRVMFSLNTLRGPIAHCGVLADDETDRLKLAVKDWFRLMQGPA